MKPNNTRTMPKRFATPKGKPVVTDPIEVYCRICPVLNTNDVICIRAKDDKTVAMVPPEGGLGSKAGFKEILYTFQYVFGENASQKELFDHVTVPLIKDLLQGTNALLFTYGITSSGKTYTMAGVPQDPGILPRTLDVVFNSLEGLQTDKYVFIPDKSNGFVMQSELDVNKDLQKESGSKFKTRRRNMQEEWSSRIRDETVIPDVNSDHRYAIFVSYVEIYNNFIYDLLEEWPTDSYARPKTPHSKRLVEDPVSNSMYVMGATEIEVKTANEALDLFSKGQQRRRISNTALNAESSRSHTVFNIRVVQAPLNINGTGIVRDRNFPHISQLSMVDLAGSERSVRTKNDGRKLQETGKINSSLMTLRNCIEALRDNQSQGTGTSKMVPYRESKLTHLFKTFFEGEGKICMVICVNPRAADFDETLHVMRFGEKTKDVMILRATPVSTPVSWSLRAGRSNFRDLGRRARDEEAMLGNFSTPIVYNLGPDFPPLVVEHPDDEETIDNLIEFLNARAARRNSLILDLRQKQEDFRLNLMEIDKENASLKQENMILRKDLTAREQQMRGLECKLGDSEETAHVQKQRICTLEKQNEELRLQVNHQKSDLSRADKEMKRLGNLMQERIQTEKERMRRLMEKKLAEKQAEIERQLCFNEEKFRQLREILNSGDWEFAADLMGPPPVPPKPDKSPMMTRAKTTLGTVPKTTGVKFQAKASSEPHVDQIEETAAASTSTQYKSVAVANPRHRRSHSSSGDVWLEHKPVGNLDLGTVLQPKMKKKKSVSKLKVEDVVKSDVSKYVLTHQEQDSNGEVETQLYKADVVPSAGGGAQVIFNDIEKLKQESPPKGSGYRKRSAENVPLHSIEKKCAVSVECHGVPSKVMKK